MADSVSVREARAQLARLIDRALEGGATVITRDGEPVAAVVSIDDYNALEDTIDEYFARKAEAVAQAEEGHRRFSMSEIVADSFGPPTRRWSSIESTTASWSSRSSRSVTAGGPREPVTPGGSPTRRTGSGNRLGTVIG